jgi:hypothetical protein
VSYAASRPAPTTADHRLSHSVVYFPPKKWLRRLDVQRQPSADSHTTID